MVDADTVRHIACALPEVEDGSSGTALQFSVAGKAFAWSLMERDGPKGPRTPRPEVLAVRCEAKAKPEILASDPGSFFETEHYRGYPAVLVRLAQVEAAALRDLLAAGWALPGAEGVAVAQRPSTQGSRGWCSSWRTRPI
jgi:hypothetical protein